MRIGEKGKGGRDDRCDDGEGW